ncbi:MAG: hypothetical protein WBF79_15700, partial [Rhodococcus sp. (in: high G+C Gram-positive bacteria)]
MSTPTSLSTDPDHRPGVHLVLAVKKLVDAKSRLATSFPEKERAELVLAMLCDTLDAATSADIVTGWSVVTPDARVTDVVEALGGRAVAEPDSAGATTIERLNRALSAADDDVRAPIGADEFAGDVIALQADLPALATVELIEAYAASPPNARS